MSETKSLSLNGVPETSLVPLYIRALETQRPDALIKDEKALALVTQMSHDFDRIRQIPMNELLRVMRIIFTREMDRYTRDFLSCHPEAVVVHIGCGLDSRFERVDNGQVEWYDLDFPNIIDLRRKFIGSEEERYHLLACSVFDDAWLEAVKAPEDLAVHSPHPILFLAETVFVYFTEAQVKSLILKLYHHFPGAELVFDACSPLHAWVTNRQISRSKLGARFKWGIWSSRKIEGWGAGIRLLNEWGFFDDPTPRLDRFRWLRPIESLLRTLRIYHFQLGEAAGI
jgi:O-methyltransferase involved in polyketide biosynthesis